MNEIAQNNMLHCTQSIEETVSLIFLIQFYNGRLLSTNHFKTFSFSNFIEFAREAFLSIVFDLLCILYSIHDKIMEIISYENPYIAND